ncbi:hypothetical protein [Streptococcus suis]|uniref:hypothetical protein n=1 Tax=Streptococcus suis TaxID=1307 RepID=UPI0004046B50|nr:hypothetical protein [Streptococcus suis]
MFRLSIPQASYTGEFENKDALIARMEQEQTKCAREGLSATCLLTHKTEQGEILDTLEVRLPLPENQLIDEVVMTFGNHKPTKQPLLSKKLPFTQKSHTEDEQATPTQTVKSSRNPLLCMMLALSLAGVGLGGFAYARIQSQETTLTQLAERLKEEQRLTVMSRKLDVFCRYFIPHYFSGNTSSLENFRTGGDWSAQTGTVQSVILESIKTTKTGYQMGYVINVNREGSVSRELLQLDIINDEKGTFGFSVDKAPKLSDYPITE